MAHIRNNCLKENTLQVEINQQCQDISLISGNDCCDELIDGIDNISNQIEQVDNKIDDLSNQSEICCDTINDKLDILNRKLKPVVITQIRYVDRFVYKPVRTIVYKTEFVYKLVPIEKEKIKDSKTEISGGSVIRRIETPKGVDPCLDYERALKIDIECSRVRWQKDKHKRLYPNTKFNQYDWLKYSTKPNIFKPKCWKDTYNKVMLEVFNIPIPRK
jgi:hypothetical protein